MAAQEVKRTSCWLVTIRSEHFSLPMSRDKFGRIDRPLALLVDGHARADPPPPPTDIIIYCTYEYVYHTGYIHDTDALYEVGEEISTRRPTEAAKRMLLLLLEHQHLDHPIIIALQQNPQKKNEATKICCTDSHNCHDSRGNALDPRARYSVSAACATTPTRDELELESRQSTGCHDIHNK